MVIHFLNLLEWSVRRLIRNDHTYEEFEEFLFGVGIWAPQSVEFDL